MHIKNSGGKELVYTIDLKKVGISAQITPPLLERWLF